MEKICATALVEFDVYNVFEIAVLRQNIRDMQEIAIEKILDMYKEIITYLVIVYEGFEAHIGQVSITLFLSVNINKYLKSNHDFKTFKC